MINLNKLLTFLLEPLKNKKVSKYLSIKSIKLFIDYVINLNIRFYSSEITNIKIYIYFQ